MDPSSIYRACLVALDVVKSSLFATALVWAALYFILCDSWKLCGNAKDSFEPQCTSFDHLRKHSFVPHLFQIYFLNFLVFYSTQNSLSQSQSIVCPSMFGFEE
jgi:hypothetical protein